MLSLHLYTKIIPKINSILPRISARQSFLNHPPVQNANQSPLISSCLIIQQKRTGTARPKCKINFDFFFSSKLNFNSTVYIYFSKKTKGQTSKNFRIQTKKN
jgi:hypothetical protein